MEIFVSAKGVLTFGREPLPCALGRAGLRRRKHEGDGATPVGRFPLRQAMYRRDRVTPPPRAALPLRAIRPDDGWCDDPGHGDYNRLVRLPHPARCELMWRNDHLYNLLVVIGYNDDPVVADRGSAIFLHAATADFAPTEGCIALALHDLRTLLGRLGPHDCVVIGGDDAHDDESRD